MKKTPPLDAFKKFKKKPKEIIKDEALPKKKEKKKTYSNDDAFSQLEAKFKPKGELNKSQNKEINKTQKISSRFENNIRKPFKNDNNKGNTQPPIDNNVNKADYIAPRLNKYISNSGVSSRRKADELIASGQIFVNNEIQKEPGYRVAESDKITYQNKELKPIDNFIYLLMNKPKGVITTNADEKGRKTIFELTRIYTNKRIYPVGRLDRDTTGLLLITNDGDLTKKLSHPSHQVKKIYHAVLNKPITDEHFEALIKGVTLEDGLMKVDGMSLLLGSGSMEVGITIHSGKNRVIRRLFEHFNYEVLKLDRVYYAGLTKKDLPRGKGRFLESKEIIMLKHFI